MIALTRFAPVALCFAFVCNLILDPYSRVLRLGFFLAYGLLGLFNLRLGFAALLLSAPWFEIPTLFLNFTNQFAIECGALGFLVALCLHRPPNSKKIHKDLVSASTHPFFLPILWIVPFGFVSYWIGMAGLSAYAPSPFSIHKLIAGTLRGLLDWNVHRGAAHSMSIVYAYTLQLCLIVALFNRRSLLQTTPQTVYWLLTLSAFPVLIYGCLQTFFPQQFPTFFRLSLSTFQNTNHFSFYAGFIVLLCLLNLAAFNDTSRFRKGLLGIELVLALTGLFAGASRTSILSLIAAISFVIFHQLLSTWRKTMAGRGNGIWITAGSLLGVFIAGTFFGESFGQTRFASKIVELASLIRSGSVSDFLAGSGREHFALAFAFLRQYPWAGIGLNNFPAHASSSYGHEIHNIYLAWGTELGMISCFFLSAAVGKSIYIFAQERVTPHSYKILAGAICFYLLLCSLADAFLSYRSLFLILSLFFTAHTWFCQDHGFSVRAARLAGKGIWIFIVGGFATGFASLKDPHFRPNLQYQDLWETVESPFRSQLKPMMDFYKVPAGSCHAFTVRGLSGQNELKMTVGIAKEAPTLLESYSAKTLIEFEQRLLTKQEIVLLPGMWRDLCACANVTAQGKSDKPLQAYIRAHTSEYLAFSQQDFGEDYRYGSFREKEVGQNFRFSDLRPGPTTINPDAHCDEILVLD